MPQKYPQWSDGNAKREGTGLPIPSQKVLIYAVSISRSSASAGMEFLAAKMPDASRTKLKSDMLKILFFQPWLPKQSWLP